MSVLQHGESVYDFFVDLKAQLREGKQARHPWKLPAWAGHEALWANLMGDSAIHTYMLFHDCGKPFCKTIDDQGRSHFPNHAGVSKAIWLSIGGSPEVAQLIGMDMDIHLLKGDDLEEFCQRKEAATLLIAGLCEIHSNAQMFGGVESTSFKMKWKHIDRRGKQIVKALSELNGEAK